MNTIAASQETWMTSWPHSFQTFSKSKLRNFSVPYFFLRTLGLVGILRDHLIHLSLDVQMSKLNPRKVR